MTLRLPDAIGDMRQEISRIRLEKSRVVAEYEYDLITHEETQDQLQLLCNQELDAVRRLSDLLRAWSGPRELCQ